MNKAKPGDADYCPPQDGGCWCCNRKGGDDLDFDIEFDTYIHLGCLKHVLRNDPNHPECKYMEYLLPEDWRKYSS